MHGEIAISARRLGKRYRMRTGLNHTSRSGQVSTTVTNGVRRLARHPRNRRRREIWAVRDVNFEVQRGEVLAVLGRNGAGKSTLLSLLAGVTSPTEGHATVRGRISALMGIGTGFHPDLSGRDNVYVNGVVLGMSRAEMKRKFDEIVEFSEIGEFIDLPVRLYSSGMAARLMFAVAAHVDPDVLLIDEVLGVGDFAFREKCNMRINRMISSGATGVLVTHDLNMAKQMCSKALVLEEGHVVILAPVEEAVEFYTETAGGPGRADVVRQRHADICIADVAVESTNGGAGLYPEDPLAIRVRLEARAPVSGKHVVLQLLVSDARGRPLASLCNRYDPQDPLQQAEVVDGVSLTCLLDALPLPPARYRLLLKLFLSGDLVDELAGIEFNILPTDFFGTGFVPPDTFPPLLMHHRWLLDQSARSISEVG